MCDCAHIPTDALHGCMLKRVATGIPEGTGPSLMSRANRFRHVVIACVHPHRAATHSFRTTEVLWS